MKRNHRSNPVHTVGSAFANVRADSINSAIPTGDMRKIDIAAGVAGTGQFV